MADVFARAAVSGGFPPTRRSAVLAVGSDDPAERARSFDVLVRAYWSPIYKHVRARWRRPAEEAREVTQAFFVRAFERRYFVGYDPSVGPFRTYLRACIDRFVMESRRDARRIKRGGDAVHLSLDFERADRELAASAVVDAAAVDSVFDQAWVSALMSCAVDALKRHYGDSGRARYFEAFRRYDLEEEATRPSYAALAAELGLRVTDVTNYLAHARRELRRLVLDRLREITATEDEFRSEARLWLGVDP